MGATITKGYTFGSTELVTSVKLHTLVDSSTITDFEDISVSGVLTCVCATASGAVGCGSLLIGQTPSTATASAEQVPFTCDSLFTISLNGTTYYIPCASASA